MDIEPNRGPTADDISRWETTMVTGDDGGKEENNIAELDHHIMNGGRAYEHGQTNGKRCLYFFPSKFANYSLFTQISYLPSFFFYLYYFTDDLVDLFETEPQSAPQEDVAHHLQRLNVGGTCAPSQGGGGAGKSCAGGIYSVPGSARTESRTCDNASMDDEELSDAEDEVQGLGNGNDNNKAYAQTQVSGDRRKKKISVVKEPVYQNTKPRRNAKAPPALQKSVPTKRGGLRSTKRGAAAKAEH